MRQCDHILPPHVQRPAGVWRALGRCISRQANAGWPPCAGRVLAVTGNGQMPITRREHSNVRRTGGL